MNIKILINCIVLESGNFSPSQRRHLQAEIENELINLLTVNGIPHGLQSGGTVSDLSVNLNNISSNIHSAKLGQTIAHSIYCELTVRSITANSDLTSHT